MSILDSLTKAQAETTASVQCKKQLDSIKKNGFKHYIFIANKDCCDICAAINGKHFPVSKFAIGVTAPPMHDKCRCSIAAWEDGEEYEAWLDFVANGGTTRQWKANKLKMLLIKFCEQAKK